MKVVVCGTKFGQVYLEAFRGATGPYELAGVVGSGSGRSRACAEHYGVPLYTRVQDVPGEVEAACVVVGSGLLGGPGAQLAKEFMDRGIHVLQEHPLHHDELADCLRHAHRSGVQYRLNSFYPHLAPVRRFLAAARELLRLRPVLYVDAACGFQVAYALFDIVGRSLGGLRSWALSEHPQLPSVVRRMTALEVPFRSVDAVLGGVPATVRIQNQMDPSDPDNYAHLLHRVTLGTEAGSLTLVATHGPVVWSPRPDFPHDVRDPSAAPHFAVGKEPDPHLTVGSGRIIGPAGTPGYHEIFHSVWPAGVRTALDELRAAVRAGEDPRRAGQYALALCRLWQEVTERLGPPELIRAERPRPLGPDEIALLEKAAGAPEAGAR
ncbi:MULTISPECIES: Gfo/Idh/MocA family oxidoreductase [unclassified Streptomyces]|uniref:Gfo/Idh/MocA family oxidoreductase n=1 Tax=unclassified Streptomyces TaxID=2593676 RepID=UPI00055C1118|nr:MULTISPECIES: Gfo/Idh/MocA family oxidoreductase [unclassified Streptomyces]MYT29249.1 Gfo/Idh/MocA family oxidoreductase [Streptomyces sp. SID8354]